MTYTLSDIYKSYKHSSINENNNFFTPIRRIETDSTAQNLSPHGIYLSGNNTLLISKKNSFSPLGLTLNKKFFINNFLPLEEDVNDQNINLNPEIKKFSMTTKNYKKKNYNLKDRRLKNSFSPKINSKNNVLLYKAGSKDQKEKRKNNKYNDNCEILSIKDDEIKSRNILFNFPSSRNGFDNNQLTHSSNKIPTFSSIFTNSQNQENKTYYKTIKKEKKINNLAKEIKKDKNNIKLKAEKIINELLSLKNKNEIRSYYIKKDYEDSIANAENNEKNIKYNINNSINPISYIKFNLDNEPKNKKLFKSFDKQTMIIGSQKYRDDLINGVNEYRNNILKYKELKGPIACYKKKCNEKNENEIIKKMKMSNIKGPGLIFSNRLYQRKNKKINNFEFDDNFKDVKKLLYKNIEKYETYKFVKGKRVKINVDKKDIKTLKKIDGKAPFVINDNNEMIKFSHKFLSFDDKINKLLLKTKNTTNYLYKRIQEHNQIRTKIDLYSRIKI